MTRVLIVYGTTDGHTRKVARRLADAMIRESEIEVEVADTGQDDIPPDRYDGVIVAASLHAGGYQPRVQKWVRRHADRLNARTTAFITVCLGVLQADPAVHRDLDRLKSRFLLATGWRPTIVRFVAGALLYRDYNWFKRLAMRRIVKKAGGDTDTSRNYEYTDWKELEAFAAEFVRRVQVSGSRDYHHEVA